MRYLSGPCDCSEAAAVLMFALKNTDPVAAKFYATTSCKMPPIVVDVGWPVAGALFGLLLTVPAAMRRRREATGCAASWTASRPPPTGNLTPVVPPSRCTDVAALMAGQSPHVPHTALNYRMSPNQPCVDFRAGVVRAGAGWPRVSISGRCRNPQLAPTSIFRG